jgi:hypothetical protein
MQFCALFTPFILASRTLPTMQVISYRIVTAGNKKTFRLCFNVFHINKFLRHVLNVVWKLMMWTYICIQGTLSFPTLDYAKSEYRSQGRHTDGVLCSH